MGIVPKRRILDAARALKVENSALQKEIRELEARIAYLDELGVWTARPNARIDKREPKSGLREGAAVALLSDVHIGEVVDPSQIDGLNKYNFEVCKRRLSKFFRGVIYLVRNDQKAFNVRDLVLWLGGDIVTGYLRDEDLEACEYSPTESSLLARGLLQEGVQFLLDELDVETIHVLCSHGNHGRCHDKSTELLTKCGWRSYDELNIGDVVATYVLESGETEWQALTDVYVDQYDGPMVHVQTRTADYMVTPRHRMVLGDVKTTTDQFMEMQEVVERGSFGAKSWPKCALGHDRDLLGVSDDELRLLGWIMTDGHYTRGVDISISQSKPEGIAALRALLAALEIEYTIGDRKRLPPVIKGVQVKEVLREYTFYLRRADAARLIELVPDRYVVPDWMRNLSRRQFNAFLDGLLAGDGHVRDRERVLYSPFEFLTQVQQLAVTNGIAARLRKDKRGDYILSLPTSTRGYVNDFKSSVQVVRYKGAIWCGTVPNGTLVTRRNGVPLVSGNTTRKPTVKTSAQNSFEHLMYQFLAQDFKDEPRANFVIHPGKVLYFPIYDYLTRWMHGESIKYNKGIGGVGVPLNRDIFRRDKARPCLITNLAHFHNRQLGPGFVINGSLVGHNEFAEWGGFPYTPPQQSFYIIDSRRGVCRETPIWVDRGRD